MQSIRKHPARILLTAAFLTLAGVWGYYYARECVAKWAFAHRTYFAADDLILIAVAEADLTPATAYLRNAGEFEWHGHMVDVLHREVRSDTVYIYGFRDDAETELKQEAAWLYGDPAGSVPPSNEPRSRRIHWESTLTGPLRATFCCVAADTADARPTFFYSVPRPALPYLAVPSPPPNA